jgi:DNA polymerase/3'-5' exonuclease PolX
MKQKLPLAQARQIAERLVIQLAPFCKRIEIAGSIRRCKAEIGDIELVAIPLPTADMFGVETMEPHQLDTVDWTQYGRMVKGGHKYKQIELSDGINLDLFIVTPPAQFGIQFLIRTGSAEFSHKFVTARQYGGFMPGYLKVKDGAIWSNNHVIETPEELDVFNLAGMPYISPELRTL